MKCDRCGHEDYRISDITTGNTATITFNVTVTTSPPGVQMPTYQFHFNCECCKNNHKDTRAHVVG